jgi:hypothetical protein
MDRELVSRLLKAAREGSLMAADILNELMEDDLPESEIDLDAIFTQAVVQLHNTKKEKFNG